jgi:hypothetical protein
MTVALCLNCGSTKWGAFCPCPACQVSSTGDSDLDIAFSDHHLSHTTLEQLGAVVKAIGTRTTDLDLRIRAFLLYVSTYHPQILTVEFPPDLREQAETVLNGLEIPEVEVRPPLKVGACTVPLLLIILVATALWFWLRG